MKRIAIFVDAGYVWAQLDALLHGPASSHGPMDQPALDHQHLRVRLLQEAQAQLPDGDLLRVYWYDTPGPDGKTADHRAMDALDDVKLRLGVPPLAGRMTADLLGLAQHRAITHALLVSHDAALVPGVLAVQAMGMRVHGLSLGEALAAGAELMAELDCKRHWGEAELHSLLTDGPAADAPTPAALLAWAPAPTLTAALSSFPSLPALTANGLEASPTRPKPGDVSLATVAQVAHRQMLDGPHAQVFAALKPGMRALPREIDGALLAMGRQALGRTLTESEKRELRRELQGVVKRVFENRLHLSAGQQLVDA